MPQPRRAGVHAAIWATLLLSSTLPALPAAAASATADQAQAVERELHEWLQSLLGSAVTVSDRPVQLTPEGGDYALVIPFGTDAAITGHLTPQDDGRWLLTGLKLPSPATFTLPVPSPPQNGQAQPPTNRTYQFSVARQDVTGTLDPSYQSASTLQQRFEGLQLSSSGGGFKQTSQAAHSTSETTLTPAADGRFDLTANAAIDGYLVDNQMDSGFTVHVVAGRGRGTTQLSSISPDKGPALLRNAISFVAQTMADVNGAGNDPGRLTAEQQARLKSGLRALVDALDGFASGMQMDDALEDLQVQAGDASRSYSGIARRATLGVGASAPDGVLKIYLDVGMEGLSVPGLLASAGLPQYADLLPTEVHLRPTLAGVGTQELLALARQALDAADKRSAPPDPTPLFAHGGIVAGLDAVSFNLGQTRFEGHGTVTMTAPSPDALTGQGQVTATNFDALIDRAKQDPLMQRALPALIGFKGIGRSSGDQIVWDITYRDGKPLVNGVDVMALAGSGGGRAGPAPRPRPPVAPTPAPAPPAPSLPGKPPPK